MLYDENIGAKTEIFHKLILRLSIHELHIDMIDKYYTAFSMEYHEILLVCISDSNLQLIISPQ